MKSFYLFLELKRTPQLYLGIGHRLYLKNIKVSKQLKSDYRALFKIYPTQRSKSQRQIQKSKDINRVLLGYLGDG